MYAHRYLSLIFILPCIFVIHKMTIKYVRFFTSLRFCSYMFRHIFRGLVYALGNISQQIATHLGNRQ
jgi:hypothetical protein